MKNPDMTSFTCRNCGLKIRVPAKFAGKKGKCPKCKAVVIIPGMSDELELKLQISENESTQSYALKPEPELQLKKEAFDEKKYDGLSADGLIVTNDFFPRPEVVEKPPQRKYFVLLDIFLYPTSMSGLINILVFCGLFLLFGLLSFLARAALYLQLALIGIGVTIVGYMLFYIIECIRDSALGGIRAPDNLSTMPSRSEALSQLWDIFIMMIILWLPLSGYYTYRMITQPANSIYAPMEDTIFLCLAGYGVFFSPIGFLALAMFQSSSAYNPIVWISSIFRTLLQYCGLVILFSILAFLISRIAASIHGVILYGALFNILFLYLAMIAAHLLGRFYYINSKKLDWEV
jgi:hypothetical protein